MVKDTNRELLTFAENSWAFRDPGEAEKKSIELK